VETPRAGDLLFYEAGYALFYFLEAGNRPFVIGMTPFGITSLKPDFAKPIGSTARSGSRVQQAYLTSAGGPAYIGRHEAIGNERRCCSPSYRDQRSRA
jgi:hypothetical protein